MRGDQFGLEPDDHSETPTVVSFAGRSGSVVPQTGDYTPELVGAEAAGAVASAITAHKNDANAHPGLLSKSQADSFYQPVGTVAGVGSFKGRSGAVVPQTGDYTPEQVGAEPAGAVASATTAHKNDANAHPDLLNRSQADALYLAAGTSGSGANGGMSWYQLSGNPRLVDVGAEVSIAHDDVQNAQLTPVVWIRQPGAQDVTRILVDFNLADVALYSQQNAAKTILDGAVHLRQADDGGVFACNFNVSADSVYGQVGTLLGSTAALTVVLNLHGSGYATWADFSGLSFGSQSWCMEAQLTPSALPGGRTGLLFQTNGGGYQPKWFWYLLPVSGTQCVLGFHVNGPGYPTIDTTTDPFNMSVGQPYHLVFQRNGGQLESFVNGARIPWSGLPTFDYGANLWPDCGANLYLGAAGDHIQTFLQADVARVRIRRGTFAPYVNGYTAPSGPFLGPNFDTTSTGWWVKTGTALRLDLSAVESLDYLSATVDEPSGTSARFLLSFDSGQTWKSNTGSGWQLVALAAGLAGGMNAQQLLDATTALDVSPYPTLDVAVALGTTNAQLTPSVDKLTLRYDEKASYSPALCGRYGSSADMGVKHWSRVTTLKNQTGSAQTIIAYVARKT